MLKVRGAETTGGVGSLTEATSTFAGGAAGESCGTSDCLEAAVVIFGGVFSLGILEDGFDFSV
jgi:hypothetical protein